MKVLNNRYELIREIESGGFATTYLGRDQMLGMDVAIKEYYETNEEKKSRLIKEARNLAKFSKEPAIVNVRDFLEQDGKVYLIMEYLEGQDLRSFLIQKGPLTFEMAYRLMRPIIGVTMKLHAAGFLHRDISPENIRMLSDGRVKLMDFGSSVDADARTGDKTITTAVKPGYAPWEQYASISEQGPWTDVYAVCATLYKCITGKTPIDSLQRVFHDDLKKPSQCGAAISPRMEEVLMKGLAVRPEMRFTSLQDFAEAIQQAAQLDSREMSAGNQNRQVQSEKAAGAERQKQPQSETAAGADRQKQPQSETAAGAERQKQPQSETAAGAERQKQPQSTTAAGKDQMKQMQPEIQQEVPVSDLIYDPDKKKTKKEKTKKEKTRKTEGKDKSSGKKAAKSGIGMKLIAIIAGIAILAGGGFAAKSLIGGNHGTVSYKDQYETIEKKTVTKKTIAALKRNRNLKMVSFYGCEISNDIISEIAGLSNVSKLHFSRCYGMDTIQPLAEMSSLESLTIDKCYVDSLEEKTPVNAETFFNGDFSQVRDLTIHEDMDFSQGTAVLSNFSGLEGLSLYIALDDYSFLDQMENLTNLMLEVPDSAGNVESHLGNLRKLKKMHAKGVGITSLEWIRNCPDMDDLDLGSDYEEKHFNVIEDASPLSTCENIRYVKLNHNPIQDISMLTVCQKTYDLDLSFCNLTSLDGVEGMGNLRYLKASGNQITDISALETCTNLMEVDLSDNQITDVSALKNGVKIYKLKLSGNAITDISSLSSLTAIKSLYLKLNQLTSLAGCENMILMEKLSAGYNQLTDVSALKGLTKLQQVNLRNNHITDVSFLSNGFDELEAIILDENEISDISSMASLTKLKSISLTHNKLTTLKGLEGKDTLLVVIANGNQLTDISALESSAENIHYLDLGENQLKDISVVGGMLRTTTNSYVAALYLENNQIEDASMIPVCDFKILSLYGNPLKDYSFAENLRKTKHLYLYMPYVANPDFTGFDEATKDAWFNEFGMVDAPSDQRTNLLKSWEETVERSRTLKLQFFSTEEADQKVNQMREDLTEDLLGVEKELK